MKNVLRRVTLADIAGATGFTINTVSRALKNKPDISRATCEHIQKVAGEMGYVRNYLASSLRSGSSRTIGVIVGGVGNPFYAIMVDSIHDSAEKMGYTVMVMCSRDTREQEERAITIAIERQVDGILLYPSLDSARNIALLRQAGIPFVLVSRLLKDTTCCSVVCDEEMGGYLAARHLIERGHRKLMYVYSFDVVYSLSSRRDGYRRAAREAGIPECDAREHHLQGEADAEERLRVWKREGVTGLFVFCDEEAWQIISVMERLHMEQDFAVVGFDNLQGYLPFPSHLCSVDGNMPGVSQAAMILLDKRIHDDEKPPVNEVFPVKLVCRGSCGKSV